ncbi:hypothetical protein N7448_006002 [Penicillium atrosanguineum]|uniref:Protein transport protein SFT2 n=1 Tax=Penicillium atrosanguineum TaxID=1132637 RepID=A0A9W9U371_9EURO|nr:uncharacterized protein N7443_009765 [Penicillium atrosanguineum]KAJ5131844.1 hypothetical protein N7448_006002 [Penicillium atrosanguineum]KAJ5137950.1 hypothetical protein N7526_004183 [Penicillium atrosanguineum]KAJ5289512.1 hypothetical protein N7443_009765 [Penicillium atrosanguineum]KAJ5307326.1 hypothetical protein N7476_007982 [Penicillium atrosanguineum]
MANNTFRDSVNSLGWSRRDPDLPVRTNASQDTSVLSRLQSLNPFGQGGYVQLPTHNEAPGAPLPAPTRQQEEEGFFALSRWDRLLIFGACNLGAAVCFLICFFLFPVLTLKPRKFAVLQIPRRHDPGHERAFARAMCEFVADLLASNSPAPQLCPAPYAKNFAKQDLWDISMLTLLPSWSVGSVLFLLSWAVLMGPWSYAKHLVSGSRLPFTAAYFGSISLTLYFAIGRQNLFLTLISSICQLVALVWYLVSYFPMGSTGLQYMGRFGANRVSAWVSG